MIVNQPPNTTHKEITMTVATPLALRWERAQQIDRSKIQEMEQGWFRVPSSQGTASYRVHLDFDAAGKLVAASGSCPDFERPSSGMGIPLLHGYSIVDELPEDDK